MSWGKRRGRSDDWGWPRYVPVAERKEKARKQAEKLRKKGQPLAPVVITGRTIAATFWGKAWCENLERYGDYENRIPRGRAYARNGSVVDLKIGTAQVDALVSGTHLYSVAIEIRPLKAGVWKGVKEACMGRIGSLLELLQGKLSREVMEIVTRPRTGLFPEPAEISFRCSCPDWASMCKHVAAVLYGVGARLDREPELLFKLRDVDYRELIAAPSSVDLSASTATHGKLIADEDLAGIFGIEIDEGPATPRRGLRTKPEAVAADTNEAPVKPRRGRPPLVHTETLLPHPKRKASIPMEKPEPRPKRGRKPIQTIPTETPEPARPRRGRSPKPADAADAPEPPKRKRGRPRLTPKTEAPIEPRRGRPPLVRNETLISRQKRKASSLLEKPEPRPKRSGKPNLATPTETTELSRLRRARTPKPVPLAETPGPVKQKRGRPPGKRKA